MEQILIIFFITALIWLLSSLQDYYKERNERRKQSGYYPKFDNRREKK